jgi:multisubunit Na+/H+ antiporter MnhC subunit
MSLMITAIVVLFALNLLIVRLMVRRSRDFTSDIHTLCAA